MEKILLACPDVLRAEPVQPPEEYAGRVRLCAIRYRSGPCEVEGYAAFPLEGAGPWPGLVFNRGGNREFGTLRTGVLCRYALRGYAVFGSQYRGNCGGTGREEFGGADVDDVIRLVDIALSLPPVRKEGVYMIGHSRGGLMTYLACARDERIRAAGICAGLADSVMMYRTREESMRQVYHELVGGSPEECPEAFFQRSPVQWAEKILPPIIICQGTADWRVVPEQAYAMDRALEAAGKEHRLVVYEGADHSLKGTSFVDDIMDWFDRHPLEDKP